LPYRIVYPPATQAHFRYLTPRQRTLVFESVSQQLAYEPTVETRNRKRLRPNPLASWELRIGNLRVYYDVEDDPQPVVMVAGVGIKRGNLVYIGGEVYPI
jgi:mRNA-degrading endonuclease RelE of RelBE toxin-antitoxin system